MAIGHSSFRECKNVKMHFPNATETQNFTRPNLEIWIRYTNSFEVSENAFCSVLSVYFICYVVSFLSEKSRRTDITLRVLRFSSWLSRFGEIDAEPYWVMQREIWIKTATWTVFTESVLSSVFAVHSTMASAQGTICGLQNWGQLACRLLTEDSTKTVSVESFHPTATRGNQNSSKTRFFLDRILLLVSDCKRSAGTKRHPQNAKTDSSSGR